ncbi:tRNA epoxyqueuosine(34) reductase QueG [Shewanella sp. WXL01]|uniref:tRNA epoxyqueuosine(34) reductase QueG n=1 Tax=Shewanella sp. WXL01 TaxID=2709721 RepID=UPI0014385999|nr:tRNA epoxyqueuosine(34) reductase QueG [Shewanella sp. WXL01]NKF49877.1 tRNA epoxyqueuosine(34) reductase QueG [Shewanella sp. WXL01]
MTQQPQANSGNTCVTSSYLSVTELDELAGKIKVWGQELGFAHVGITHVDLSAHENKLQQWLDNNYHGEMSYMATHGMMRARPAELHPGTIRVISARMDYLPPNAGFATNLADPNLGYISRYAGGRDYHKLMRQRLKKLGEKISSHCESLGSSKHNFRPFVDSAPILERPLADNAGLGWTGKHTLLIHPEAGSWFFLGELLVDIPLPIDEPIAPQCNTCVACIKSCPTDAIVAEGIVDARRCISYLTIELQGVIPVEFREAIGNRIYGCDDCQLVCPFNASAPLTQERDFHTRDNLIQPDLLTLFAWDEQHFLTTTQGSAIRRIGHKSWLRNIAIALGNAPYSEDIVQALQDKRSSQQVDDMVIEHIDWAIERQQTKSVEISRKTQRVIRTVQKGLSRDA